MKTITKADIKTSLNEVGVREGDTLMVHTSLTSIGYVCGGAQAVIEAQSPVNTVILGDAKLRYMSQRKLVDFAVEWIEANRKFSRGI